MEWYSPLKTTSTIMFYVVSFEIAILSEISQLAP